ncbi:MAG: hypothetical protein K2X57_11670 [Xanthobacteraceae bacterium]|nr:hypothetical protein [Xanthobacteraceae bacterium]
MSAPGAKQWLARSVPQISCGIKFVEWFNGTGPETVLFCERGPSARAFQLCGLHHDRRKANYGLAF